MAAPSCGRSEASEFVLKMMNFVLKMMDFVSKMLNFGRRCALACVAELHERLRNDGTYVDFVLKCLVFVLKCLHLQMSRLAVEWLIAHPKPTAGWKASVDALHDNPDIASWREAVMPAAMMTKFSYTQTHGSYRGVDFGTMAGWWKIREADPEDGPCQNPNGLCEVIDPVTGVRRCVFMLFYTVFVLFYAVLIPFCAVFVLFLC